MIPLESREGQEEEEAHVGDGDDDDHDNDNEILRGLWALRSDEVTVCLTCLSSTGASPAGGPRPAPKTRVPDQRRVTSDG